MQAPKQSIKNIVLTPGTQYRLQASSTLNMQGHRSGPRDTEQAQGIKHSEQTLRPRTQPRLQ